MDKYFVIYIQVTFIPVLHLPIITTHIGTYINTSTFGVPHWKTLTPKYTNHLWPKVSANNTIIIGVIDSFICELLWSSNLSSIWSPPYGPIQAGPQWRVNNDINN